MSKRKIWLIVAGALMLVGGVLFAVTMGIVGPNFEELSTMKYQDKRYEFNEDFTPAVSLSGIPWNITLP